MRNNVVFRYPEEFVAVSNEDGILAAAGAKWFAQLLERVEGAFVDDNLCQEDWGVVVFVNRRGLRYWVGLSFWDEGEWIAHFHHHSFAWIQRFTTAGKLGLEQLVLDFDTVLKAEPTATAIAWYHERDMLTANPLGRSHPSDE